MLWGGRFSKQLNNEALNFSSSLSYDIKLINEDIRVSIVHSEMLANIGLISNEEALKIKSGLEQIKSENENSLWIADNNKFEDIHSAIESRLYELIGETAGKLHTGRSRNDLIATDFQLWVKKSSISLIEYLTEIQKSFINIASQHVNTLIPGYTHLQQAQPISFAFHLLAYVEMFERDKKRFEFVIEQCGESPLGSGALAGSTLPLDRNYTSKNLGFNSSSRNALDSISNRDFVLDFLNSISTGMIHLSKLSEELIIWSTLEWSFIKIGDDFTTGSSLMPQKKNPDMAELIRGKSGRVIGNMISLYTTLKGLPLSYNRDLQEDKEPAFDSFETYSNSLIIMDGLIKTVEVNNDNASLVMKQSPILATDIADYLVLKNVPFREAHEIVGKVVKFAEENELALYEIKLEDFKVISNVFDSDVFDILDISTSLNRKKTFGSPNPEMVREQIDYWKNFLTK